MANEVSTRAAQFGLPAHLQGKPKDVSWGEIDPKQRMLPRIKLLQASNPEISEYPREAIPGEFWHTTLTTSLGPEVSAVPIMRRQTYNLWAPRIAGEDRGILARALPPHYNWDPPNGVFNIRHPGNPKTYTWRTASTVKESGLAEWGSSMDDDPKSRPAATLTFEVLWYLPDFNTLALTLNTRSGVKAAKLLFAMVDAKPTNAYNQLYTICSTRNQGPTGETFYGWKYRGAGYCSEGLCAITKPIFEAWKDVAFASSDEEEDVDTSASERPQRYSPAKDAMSQRGARMPEEPQGKSGVVDDDAIPF